MKFLPRFSAKIAFAALALSALASLASAAEINMHVPMAARWGNKLLPAGDYRLDFNAGSPFVRVSGNGQLVTVVATDLASQTGRSRSFATFTNVNGVPTITALAVRRGTVYEFALPKSASHTHGS